MYIEHAGEVGNVKTHVKMKEGKGKGSGRKRGRSGVNAVQRQDAKAGATTGEGGEDGWVVGC